MSVEQRGNTLLAASVALCGCDAEELKTVANQLTEMGCAVHMADTIDQLDRMLGEEKIDAIIAHFCPSRLEFLPIMDRAGLPPLIPLLRHADKYMYMDLLRRGAFDCVPLPSQESELRRVLNLAVSAKDKRMAFANEA
jgi:DNA-binding NtrC family response regulator